VHLPLALAWLACNAVAPVPPLQAAPVDRDAFNQRAAEIDLGLFWARDDDGHVDPSELVPLWGAAPPEPPWTEARLPVRRETEPAPEPESGPEERRRQRVLDELRQSRPTLVLTDLSGADPADASLVEHLLAAGTLVERLFQAQRGADRFAAPEDPASRALLRRNQGPWCEAPATRDDPDCSALPGRPPARSGLYPDDLQADPGFCATLPETLLDPFTAVRRVEGQMVAVPYAEAWPELSQQVREQLLAAAGVLGPEEAALRAYLEAAADAFVTGRWFAADEAWAAMNASNSAWYLRIGPDETYFEPCDRKAGFHMVLARQNPASLAWQQRLEPVKAEMEQHLAALAGEPYAPRQVSFSLPDFVDIVVNAGEARRPFGATIGQSLPNWGPVADESRGRTVAMTNLDPDPALLRAFAGSMLCADTMVGWVDDPEPLLMSTVLHEAAHNLGPSASYRVGGRTADQAFGGDLSSTLEELKAQTAAIVLYERLAAQGTVEVELARQARVRDLVWALGKIALGMFDGQESLTYGQMSAIQLGILADERGLAWRADALAANGTDRGCFELLPDGWSAAVEALGRTVLGIKARNDVDAAQALVERHVTGTEAQTLHSVVRERGARHPTPTYVYGVLAP
jgi:hypothetical protein